MNSSGPFGEGVVRLPSGWAPEAAWDRGVGELHAVVPELNAQLAGAIERSLRRVLEAGVAYARENRGLCVGTALDRHPRHGLPGVDAHAAPDDIHLRVEQQLLAPLPRARGLLFAIRVRHTPWVELRTGERAAIRRELAAMPTAVRRYKRV